MCLKDNFLKVDQRVSALVILTGTVKLLTFANLVIIKWYLTVVLMYILPDCCISLSIFPIIEYWDFLCVTCMLVSTGYFYTGIAFPY